MILVAESCSELHRELQRAAESSRELQISAEIRREWPMKSWRARRLNDSSRNMRPQRCELSLYQVACIFCINCLSMVAGIGRSNLVEF